MPRDLRVVIVGGVATGPKTAARLRRLMPTAKITIVEKGRFLSYAGCGLPYYLEGVIAKPEELFATAAGIPRDAAYFKSERDVDVLTETEAILIDRPHKEVVVRRLGDGHEYRLSYDKLVLATGASPVSPPLPGLDLNRVYHLHQPEDAFALRNAVAKGELRDVVVIGAGLIGMEATEALSARGVRVTVLEMMDRVLPALLDQDMASIVEKYLRDKEVDLRTSDRVVRIDGTADGFVKKVETGSGVVNADGVLVAAGVRPNTSLAKAAGLEIGETGAIAVDRYLRTSDADIYAGGDCVENVHRITGRQVFAPLGSTANKHGRVIAGNIAGLAEEFPGVLGTSVLKLFDYTIARSGLCESEARSIGRPLVYAFAPQQDRAHYYLGHQPIIIKIIADAEGGRVLGFQIVGTGAVDKRADVLITAMSFGATLKDVADLDLGYAPPYSTAIDAVAHAANVGRNKLDGLAVSIGAAEVRNKIKRGDDFIFLDVRTPKEFADKRIAGRQVQLLPLGELRRRLEELPRDKEIIVYCGISLRAYEATRILKGAGFPDVKYVDGGITAWPYETVTEKRRRDLGKSRS